MRCKELPVGSRFCAIAAAGRYRRPDNFGPARGHISRHLDTMVRIQQVLNNMRTHKTRTTSYQRNRRPIDPLLRNEF